MLQQPPPGTWFATITEEALVSALHRHHSCEPSTSCLLSWTALLLPAGTQISNQNMKTQYLEDWSIASLGHGPM